VPVHLRAPRGEALGAVEQADEADEALGGTRLATDDRPGGGAASCPRWRETAGTASQLIASVRRTGARRGRASPNWFRMQSVLTSTAARDMQGVRSGVPVWWAWVALVGYSLAAAGGEALLKLGGREVPAGPPFLFRFISLFLTWQWLEAECRASRRTYPLDMGMFLFVAGVVLVPYFMWQSQRWRGLLKVGAMLGVTVGSYALAYGATYAIEVLRGR
jgi:hypothetical protein